MDKQEKEKRKIVTIQENLKNAIQTLKEKQLEEPMLKARLLLCYILKVEKEYLVIHSQKEMRRQEEEKYQKALQKLIEGYPLQYITHHQEFMKLNFYIDENVLIPRADTEVTVEEVITYCKEQEKRNLRVLDLCTGSGAIAISVKKYVPNCEVVAVDISRNAIEVAKRNAKQNEVDIIWVLSNLFEEVKGHFDVIVSNPPYIKKEVIKTLDKQVQCEPILALDGGEDGLDFYKKIIEQAPDYLKENGKIFLEIGYDQKQEVLEIIEKTKQYKKAECKKDLAGNDRMIMAKKERGEECVFFKRH